MSYTYTYILAPDAGNNAEILHSFTELYPDLVEERRVKAVFERNDNDVLDDLGGLLVPAGPKHYLLKATSSEFNPAMLEGVTDPQLYNKDTLPFSTFWL